MGAIVDSGHHTLLRILAQEDLSEVRIGHAGQC